MFEVTHLLHEPSTPLLSLSHPSPLNKCSTASFPFSHILTLIERLLHHLLFALNFMHLPCFPASGSQKRCLSPLPAMSQIYCLLSLQYLTYCHDFLSTVFEAQTKSSWQYCNVSTSNFFLEHQCNKKMMGIRKLSNQGISSFFSVCTLWEVYWSYG